MTRTLKIDSLEQNISESSVKENRSDRRGGGAMFLRSILSRIHLKFLYYKISIISFLRKLYIRSVI